MKENFLVLIIALTIISIVAIIAAAVTINNNIDKDCIYTLVQHRVESDKIMILCGFQEDHSE